MSFFHFGKLEHGEKTKKFLNENNNWKDNKKHDISKSAEGLQGLMCNAQLLDQTSVMKAE